MNPRILFTGLILLASGCHLLVDSPVAPPSGAAPRREPRIDRLDLLRFTVENLGEVEPGLLYRSARTSPALLE
ncbi:MAG: hypothetical protein JXA90_14120, partial [Planctomycetes bacterium]|nr:hypothetical protein [Planctomycetota bacterium]